MRRCALALALTAFAALPAIAQGTVRTHDRDRAAPAPEAPPPTPQPDIRDHRGVQSPPPAPTPGVRDRRISWDRSMTPGQPVQWAVRNVSTIKPGERYAIVNLRRTQLGQEAQLAFYDCGTDSVCKDATQWDPNGGMFEFRRAPSPAEKGAITVDEYVALYNTKTRRYFWGVGNWSETPQYDWQLRGLKSEALWVSFSLYSSQAGAYLVMMEQGVPNDRQNCCSDLGLITVRGRID